MTLPSRAVHEIERFCDDQTPPDFRDQMRMEATFEGDAVTIADCRPPWDGGSGEWTRTEFAQLRYDEPAQLWTLYWADSDDRWHRYEELAPSPNLSELLSEIADDPTGIFLG